MQAKAVQGRVWWSSCVILFFMLLMISCSRNKSADIHYPSPLPDSIPQVFLPGIVSGEELDFNAAFSLDGNTFYFARGKRGKYIILESKYDGKSWTEPVPSLQFDTTYSNADPFVVADSSIYFISNRPKDMNDKTDDYDIYRIRHERGKWTPAEYVLGVNSDSTEYYVSLSATGTMFFASYREGNLDLYKCDFRNGIYSSPVNLGKVINSDGDEHDPYIAPDESYIVFNSDRPGGFGEADLYISQKKDGFWQPAINLGSTINTKTYEYCTNMSPDGKYLFFSSESQVKWVSSDVLKKYLISESEKNAGH